MKLDRMFDEPDRELDRPTLTEECDTEAEQLRVQLVAKHQREREQR